MDYAQSSKVYSYDVCVYGGTSGGVIAAYSAKRMGKSVLLIEPTTHLGGLTSGGLGYTDIGNKYAVTGLGLDFYRQVGKHYGQFESWIFEPHVAENVFRNYIQKAGVKVLYRYRIRFANFASSTIKDILLENVAHPIDSTILVKAKVFIDCSYEGDLMAKAGVHYFVGRESNNVYHETYNGVQVQPSNTPQRGNQIPDGVDPYKIPGDPKSGLLWGISNAPLAPIGSGDKHVQAYNFRICLTDDSANRISITRPEDYDSSRYALLPRYIAKLTDTNDIREILKFDLMPNHKTDINNGGGFSTDMIGANWDYPEADYGTRAKIQKAHELYDKGLLYFIQHDLRIPAAMRNFLLNWGYPKDEYTDIDNWSFVMYIREARRMIGEYIMTQANCEGKTLVNDGIAMAAYGMDSHNTQRIVINGMVKNEGDVEKGGFPPYPISYRALIPKKDECKNLLVPICLSASHIAYGSIRMEPVFMVLGESAGIAAALAAASDGIVQNVDVNKIQHILNTNPLLDGSIPDILIDNRDSAHLEIHGKWKLVPGGFYGPDALIAQPDFNAVNRYIAFHPTLEKNGNYHIYTYIKPSVNNIEETINYLVFDGKRKKNITIRHRDITVTGQTSGEWISLGKYHLSKEKSPYVMILADKTQGVIAADAVLFVPDK
ncbi:MAG: FAD-dependent oxidoreductase [Chitinophagaceae bacterium]